MAATTQPDAVAGAEAVEQQHHTTSIADQQQLQQHPNPSGSEPVEMDILPQQQGQLEPNDENAPPKSILPQQTTTANDLPTEADVVDAPIQQPLSPHSLSISLMLTTGARHPYTIDERYLRSRNFEPKNTAGEVDPRELSGYQLKELIWTDWRSEWEPKPANPSSIRLIILGRMIEDKSALRDYPFKATPPDPNVVHMTVRPADLEDPDDGAGTSKQSAFRRMSRRSMEREVEGESRERSSRCCVIL